MPLTAAEKQKRYRERMRSNNPEKYEEAKIKNAARNKKRKKISTCTEKEKEALRKQWRKRKNNQKKKLNDTVAQNESNTDTHNSGPDTYSDSIIKARLAERKKCSRYLAIVKMDFENKIKDLANELKNYKKKCKRRIQKQNQLMRYIEQLKAKNAENLPNQDPIITMQDQNEMTPLSKTESFINESLPNISTTEKQKVKKQLLGYNVLANALQNTYKNSKNNKERNTLKNVVENDIMNKYRVKCTTTVALGLKGRARRRKDILRNNCMIVEEIKQFYERDDVTRATSGKNEVKTLKKNKKQRRYLLKTLKDLYKKYRAEGGKAKYSSFKKYRPFYVLRPKLSNRETCGCTKHENFMLKTEKLKTLGMIDTKDIDTILTKVQCDLSSKECAYEECSTCNNKSVDLNWGDHSRSEIVTYEEFKLEKHEYLNKKDNKISITKKMEKKQRSETLESLTENFENELKLMKKHVFNIKHQYFQYSTCIKHLEDFEVAIHIDFSENYTCKLATEVQSMHFAGSKPQITVHTGVLYRKGNLPQAFASVSPDNEHGPEAIWAHLEPILSHVRTELPEVTAVHFFSDGPSTQYKQKKNFFLFSKITKALEFPYSTWNFSEASHGKGAADGVGGAIKRRLDDCVAQGKDIPNAEIAYQTLKNSDTSIMTFYISETDIAKYVIPDELTPVPQTMALHQIVNTDLPNVIKFRCLSCFCSDSSVKGYCECLDITMHSLVRVVQTKNYNKENKAINNADRNDKTKRVIHMKRRVSDIYEKTDSKQEETENGNEIKKIKQSDKYKEKTKVTILSDVKYKPENRAFSGMQNPLRLKKISQTFDLLNTNKDHQMPSTSRVSNRKSKIIENTNKYYNSDTSSTENDDEFSVHDSSEDQTFIHSGEEDYFNSKDTKEEYSDDSQKKKNDMDQNVTVTNSSNKDEESTAIRLNKDTETLKTNKDCESTDNKDKTLSKETIKTLKEDPELPNSEVYNVGDSVIVRYFLRQSWKYYIGFIKTVEIGDEIRYEIQFLKTILKPKLKFITSNKDRDIVPCVCVVKKVELDFNNKAYYLQTDSENDCNQIYFGA